MPLELIREGAEGQRLQARTPAMMLLNITFLRGEKVKMVFMFKPPPGFVENRGIF